MSMEYDAIAKIYLEVSRNFQVIKPKFGIPYLALEDSTPLDKLGLHNDILVVDHLIYCGHSTMLSVKREGKDVPLGENKFVKVDFRYVILKTKPEERKISLSDLETRISEGKGFLVSELGKSGIDIKPETIKPYLETEVI